jgi:hypothetical protein
MFAKYFRRAALAALAAAAVLASGCGTRVMREPVLDTGELRILLRSYKRGGQVVERGFAHPAVIAPVRLAHILAYVDVEVTEDKKKRRTPALPVESVYDLADALSAALEKAGPNQEVVVFVVRREKRYGLFHQDYLSTFVACVEGGLLQLHFGHVDWMVPKLVQSGVSQDAELPEPKPGKVLMDFRVVPDTAFMLVDPQTVAFEWKSDRFREPDRVRMTPGGQIKRRTVLMEADPGIVEEQVVDEAVPEGLSPETLRALADLEEQRRRGEISEADYQARRRALLAGAR